MIAGRFLRSGIPALDRLLLVESGSREIFESLLPKLYERAPGAKFDLLTCYGGAPSAFRPGQGELFSVHDYPDKSSRDQFFAQLAARRYGVTAIICSAEPIMTKWKWYTAWRVKAKVMIVNENADFFWLDRGNWRTAVHFILFRADLTGGDAARTLVRLALFPVSLAYLLLYAAAVHTRRALRLS